MIGWLGILDEKLNAKIWHSFKNLCIKVWQIDQIIIIIITDPNPNCFMAIVRRKRKRTKSERKKDFKPTKRRKLRVSCNFKFKLQCLEIPNLSLLSVSHGKGNSCYYSWACRQSFFCLRLHSYEAYGSIQWKMTHKPRFHVKTADNCNNSHWPAHGQRKTLTRVGFKPKT